jgi:glycosyltransferase involved in cell wall biosynthesis
MSRLIWHSTSPWAPSGYGTQTAIWIQKLKEMGHEVTVSSYWGLSGASTTWNDIPILPGYGQAYCSTSLYQHAQAIKPDLVITLGDVWVTDPSLLSQLPIAHWLPADCRPMSVADRNVAEANGAQLIAMSKFGFDRFKNAGFSPVYVPHGIDTGTFSFIPEKRDEIRQRIGLDGTFTIGINGANNDAIRKAIPEMMLAFAKFHKHHPEALLAIHSGVHQDGGQDLEAVAGNLGLMDLVRVVDQYRYSSGFVTPEELADWYRAIDVLACCSYGEGFGLPLVESQACGTPVITTKASSMEELNPLGIQVEGEPFWNGVHRAWWIRPSVKGIYEAFEDAYDRRDEVPREKLREFAEGYDADLVCEKYMKPALQELLDRMGKRSV